MRTVFIIPGRIKDNPYLTLLYDAVRAHGEYDPQPFSWAGLVSALVWRQRPIVHIHWETNLYGSVYATLSVIRMVRILSLGSMRLLGARIIWTMHNAASHDYPHPRIDRWGRWMMWQLAQVVIIQNRTVIARYRAEHPGKRIVYIPHGNYIGVYGVRADDARAKERNTRGYADTDTVFIGIGMIRPYKKYEDAIDAVRAAEKKRLPVRLIIAGKGEAEYVATLKERAGNSNAIHFEVGRIADADVAPLFAMADYALFAYGESSLTSGALLWALSYGLPCIVGDMPASELVFDGVNGYHVPAQGLVSLIESVAQGERLDRDRVVATVQGYGWEEVARETVALYASST